MTLLETINQVLDEGKPQHKHISFHPLLLKLRPLMVQEAQKIYDDWEQDEEGMDDAIGSGGICDQIAEAIMGIISMNISGVEVTLGGQDGDEHAWSIAYNHHKEMYGIDIPHQKYETGGGMSWKKIPGVKFELEDIEIWKIDDIDISELEG